MKSHTIGKVTFKWWLDDKNQPDAAIEYLGREYKPREVPDQTRAGMTDQERGAVEQLAMGFEFLEELERLEAKP